MQVISPIANTIVKVTTVAILLQTTMANPDKCQGMTVGLNSSIIINNSSTNPSNNLYLSSKLINNLEKVKSFAELKENWNGYNAPAFSENHINLVCDILRELPIQPEVFPTGRGSIQLEYEPNDESCLELEIFEDGTVLVYLETVNGYVEENTRVEKIKDWVNDFYGML